VSGYPYAVPSGLLELAAQAKVIWLATHERPDADGYGSLLASGLALTALGKDIHALVEDEVPAHFDALPGHLTIPRVTETSPEPDLLLIFDCHRLDRLGLVARLVPSDVPVAVLDHHPVDDRGCEAAVGWIEPDAAATAIVVLSFLRKLPGCELSREQATCLYAALVTDTGGFRYQNTSADTFLAAADLVAAGADAPSITETFLHRRRPEALTLLGRVFDGVVYHADGRVITATIPSSLLTASATEPSETEGVVSFLGSVTGVRLVALGIEYPDAQWRVSLRAKPPHFVNGVARGFGGGGHAAAAAFTVSGRWEEFEPRLLEALFAQLHATGSRG
jgi:bifunctional oligoribonuclease and PAP phosphatase NrnA